MFGPPLAGRYALKQELGSGAYARVFLADDQKLGRAVAVKVLNAASAGSQEAIQRLEREGRLSAAINHPNVCAVSDVGRLDNGLPFLVMEHLSGETLSDRLSRETKLPVAVAVDLAEQLLLALFAAHRLGIVHRDVKPANVFLVNLGLGRQLLKLLDFGTAYLSGSVPAGETLTRAGLVVGTPEYMSPEQLRGLRDFDARTDVYACGVVLHEMLSGHRPFTGLDLAALAQAIAFKQPPPLAGVAPFVPPPIARAVDMALALNPSRRHADAAAFLTALGQGTVPEVLPTAGMDALREGRAVVSHADDWDLPTTEASMPAIMGHPAGEWEVATSQSGPPSGIGAGTIPMTAPLVRESADAVAIDVALDEALQPTQRPRR
jgi:eukaryotic-like serine/threonine-protein kinase